MNPLANLPPAPIFTPGDLTYNDRWNAWVQQSHAAMDAYRAEYAARMAEQGISVSWDKDPDASPGSPFALPPVFRANLTKDGVTATTLLSLGRAQTVDPDALADYDQTFNLKWNAQVTSPQGQLPSAWFEPVTYSAPGPATTVPVPASSTQPAQAPATPSAGTYVDPPASPVPTASGDGGAVVSRYNFWEWNWFYEQETGRVGPDHNAVGVTDPTAKTTRAEWWNKVSAWYGGAGVPVPSSNPPGLPAGGGAPTGGGAAPVDPPTGGPGGGSTPTALDTDKLTMLAVLGGLAFVTAKLVR